MRARQDDLFVYDIVECCNKVSDYVDGVTEAAFHENSMLQDALVRNIEIIGEAAKT